MKVKETVTIQADAKGNLYFSGVDDGGVYKKFYASFGTAFQVGDKVKATFEHSVCSAHVTVDPFALSYKKDTAISKEKCISAAGNYEFWYYEIKPSEWSCWEDFFLAHNTEIQPFLATARTNPVQAKIDACNYIGQNLAAKLAKLKTI
jgi:hypothetical protein